MEITVRDYRVSDLPVVINLFRDAFPQELSGAGLTIEEYIRWLRITQGWAFGPLRLLARLSQVEGAVLVAEAEGKVVGTMTFIGHGHIAEASSALVDSAYQRQGVASALGDEMRHRIVAHKNFTHVRTVVTQTNAASLALNKRFGLEMYDCYMEYDLPLPLANDSHGTIAGITSRPRRPADQSVLEELVRRTLPAVFEIEGFAPMNILVGRVYSRLVGTRVLERVYEQNGRLVGSMRAWTDRKSTKGLMDRPFLDNVPGLCDLMRREAAVWIGRAGKTVMRVSESGQLQATPSQNPMGWVRLARRL